MQNGSTTEKAVIIMQLDFLFFLSPPARMSGAKSLWKSMAKAATNQSNTPCKATDHRFSTGGNDFTLYHGKDVPRNFETPAYGNRSRDAHGTASKH